MRFGSTLMVAGLALLAATSAQAQTSYQAVTPSGGYVYTGPDVSSYSPIYNTNAQPLSMEQAIKGKNAPSYSFKNSKQPYNFGTTDAKRGPMTSEEASRMRMLRDQQAILEEEKRAAIINAQNAAPAQQGYNNLTQFLPGGQQQQQRPTKKRLVYREDADPLRAPPRLFNPDQ